MTHSQRLVCVIKSQGKVLRESENGVALPFGAEYSVLVKNLDSKRIQIAVSIDGQDAAGRLIVNANSELELERYIKNGNLQSGNKFKFIERSPAVEQHRGVGAEDGLVRVEAWTEIPQVQYTITTSTYPAWYPPRRRRFDDYNHTGGTLRSSSIRGMSVGGGTTTSNFLGNLQSEQNIGETQVSYSATVDNATTYTLNDAGITAPGSESNQRFVTVPDFLCETQSTVVVLRLRGVVGNQVVQRPVTVDRKPVCVTCGRHNKGSSKFCSQCGTALVIL